MSRALVCTLLLLTGCASKEAAIQTGLDAGMTSCEVLLADPTIEASNEARAWCERMVSGCHDLAPVTP